jgi:hypothetical protein
MRVFIQASMAAMLLIASLLSMANGNLLEAIVLFAGAIVFGWHVFAAKAWANWGEAGSIMDAIAIPAGPVADDGLDDAPFDPDAALAHYLKQKAAGEVEPLTDPAASASPRASFGRKAR